VLSTTRQNQGYKLVAVLCATVLSLYVRLERGPQGSPITDRIEVRRLDPGLELQMRPESVSVTLLGPADVVRRTQPADLDTYVDLQGLRAGQHTVPVRCEPVAFPQMLQCRPDPPTVAVTLRARVSERRPVEVHWVGSPPLGKSYVATSVDPTSALVTGADNQVERVRRVVANVTTTGSPVSDSVSLQALDQRGVRVSGVTVTPPRVQVTADLRPSLQVREVYVTPQLKGHVPAGYRLVDAQVTPVTVRATGPAEDLALHSVVLTEPLDLGRATDTEEVRLRLQPLPKVAFSERTVSVRLVVEPLDVVPPAPTGETRTGG
jgi:YbbR domain-containing protein